ncbi:MAG TPA: hypothetical protein VL528_00295 [Oxalicibacterium sp.]|jgi:hypothetical protein|nr:hypothetical protein [Oxalicibacterium sp.]
MPYQSIGDYEIEYEAVQVPSTEQWAAYLTIYGPSKNPMHRNVVFPHQQVAVAQSFSSKEAAETEAQAVALTLLGDKAP